MSGTLGILGPHCPAVGIRLDDLSPYCELLALRRRISDLLARHPLEEDDAPEPPLDALISFAATAACRSVADGMRAGTAREQVCKMRDADAALTALRVHAFDAMCLAGWPGWVFDEVARRVATCLREVLRYESSARRYARTEVDFA